MAFVIGDAKTLSDDPLELDPTHHAVLGTVRPCRDQRRQFCQLVRCQAADRPVAPLIVQAIRPRSIEPVRPVPQGLPVHTADPCRFAPVGTVAYRSQRQKAPCNIRIPRTRGQKPYNPSVRQSHQPFPILPLTTESEQALRFTSQMSQRQ